MEPNNLRRIDIDMLDRYWDEVNLDRIPTDLGQIDEETANLITRLRSLGDPPEMDRARARVERNLADRFQPVDEIRTQVVPPFIARDGNGLTRGREDEDHDNLERDDKPNPIRHFRRVWPIVELAAAVLLVISVVGLTIGGPRALTWLSDHWREDAPVSEWPISGGDAARTGVTTAPGPEPPLQERWHVSLPGVGSAKLVVADGVVYAGSCDQPLQAFDAETGALVWGQHPPIWVEGVPAVSGDLVFVGGKEGHFFALDAATGEEQWRFEVGGSTCFSPAVADGVVFLGSDLGAIYALNATTGTIKWQGNFTGLDKTSSQVDVAGSLDQPVECVCLSEMAVDSASVYVGTGQGLVTALDRETGQERWTFQTEAGWVERIAVDDGNTVYAGNYLGALYAIDAKTGLERWRFSKLVTVLPSIVTHETIFAAGDDGNLYALEAASGRERWKSKVSSAGAPDVVLAGGVIYGSGEFGTTASLYELDASTGAELWRIESVFGGDIVAIVGDTIYSTGYSGSVSSYLHDAAESIAPSGTPTANP